MGSKGKNNARKKLALRTKRKALKVARRKSELKWLQTQKKALGPLPVYDKKPVYLSTGGGEPAPGDDDLPKLKLFDFQQELLDQLIPQAPAADIEKVVEAVIEPIPPVPEPVQDQVIPMPAEQLEVLPEVEAIPVPPKKAKKKDDFGDEIEGVLEAVATGLAKKSASPIGLPIARDEAVIKLVRDAKVEDLVPVMGELMATRLKYFCDNVDLDHPHIQDTLREGFQPNSEFNGTLREIMAFAALPNGQEMPRMLALMRESFTKAKTMKDVRVAIFKPHARTLATAEARAAARSAKTAKEVALKEWLDKTRGWNDHPASFRSFTRLNDAHAADVAENTRRSQKMAELGMTALAASFGKRNEVIAAFLGEQYAGFTRIKMLDAAIILAKSHGAVYREDYRTVFYSRKTFAKNIFWLEPDTPYIGPLLDSNLEPVKDAAGEPLKEKKVTVQACMIPDNFTFKPRAYPLHEFKVARPQHVQDALAAVEAHPDMNGKAVFDQFWVIVPGIALSPEMHHYPTEKPVFWVLANPGKHDPANERKPVHLFDKQDDAERFLDFRLTEEGCLRPALLGEKDGKCFFINYW